MKKIFTFALLTFLVISSLGLISATTFVGGTIYNEDFASTISGALVSITCNHEGDLNIQNTTSSSEGTYAVTYNEVGEDACDDGDFVTVVATYGNLSGSETGIVLNDLVGDLDVAIVNVPIVPEFGVIIGILTIFGAVGVFFIVRRE